MRDCREYETVIIETEEPLNLRIISEAVAKSIIMKGKLKNGKQTS